MEMNKEKQIEEIAKEIEKSYTVYKDFCPRKLNRCGTIRNCTYCNIATNLIEQGYRKINENEVVISKEEYERLQSTINRLRAYDRERDIQLHANLISKARLKTAREIMEMIKEYYGSISILKSISIRYGVDLGETK